MYAIVQRFSYRIGFIQLFLAAWGNLLCRPSDHRCTCNSLNLGTLLAVVFPHLSLTLHEQLDMVFLGSKSPLTLSASM